jgi:hypothetical protein
MVNLREHYVYANVAQQMIDALINHEKAGNYEQQTDGDGMQCPLVKGLPQELRAGPTVVNPVLFTAAFGNRSNAAITLNLVGRSVPVVYSRRAARARRPRSRSRLPDIRGIRKPAPHDPNRKHRTRRAGSIPVYDSLRVHADFSARRRADRSIDSNAMEQPTARQVRFGRPTVKSILGLCLIRVLFLLKRLRPSLFPGLITDPFSNRSYEKEWEQWKKDHPEEWEPWQKRSQTQ